MKARRFLLAAALAATALMTTATSAAADAAASVRAGGSAWVTADAGQSFCSGQTLNFTCNHDYSSYDETLRQETCRYVISSAGPEICHASLSGSSTGAGVLPGEGVALDCDTRGAFTGVFDIGGAAADFPPFQVTIVVNSGSGKFSGYGLLLSGVDVLVQKASGTFTLGCGSPRINGERAPAQFAGIWTVGANI